MASDLGTAASYIGTVLGTLVTTVAVGWPRIKKALAESATTGASSGASNTLNGTAEAVREIRGMLQGHVTDSQQRFTHTNRRLDDMGESLGETREEVAHLRGRFDQFAPQTAKKPKPKKKPTRARR